MISETQVGMNKRVTQHVKPQCCKTRVSSWPGHTLNQTPKKKPKSALLPGNPLIWLQGSLWRELSTGHLDHKNHSIMCMFLHNVSVFIEETLPRCTSLSSLCTHTQSGSIQKVTLEIYIIKSSTGLIREKKRCVLMIQPEQNPHT